MYTLELGINYYIKKKYQISIHNLYTKDFKKTHKNLIQILNQSLWLNENLKINNAHLYNKQFFDKGILYIKDILDDNGNFLNHRELTSKYKLNMSVTEYLQLKTCIPREWERSDIQSRSFSKQNTRWKLYSD